MSREEELKARAEALYKAVVNLYDEEKIRELCEAERKWLDERYSLNSLGTILSRHYNKKFKGILLTDGNSFWDKSRLDQPVGCHLFFKYCGFSNEEWQQRNDTIDTPKKIVNAPAIDPDKYLDKVSELLLSEDPYELGVGLIAATGCRPIEILYTGKFAPVAGEAYQISFSGQAKKRGKSITFKRPVLFPSDFLIKCLNKFRRFPEIKDLKFKVDEITNELKVEELSDEKLETEIKRRLSDARCSSLWRKASECFKNVIPPKDKDLHVNNQALRAAFGTLITERDIENGSHAAYVLYYARAIGHIPKDEGEVKKSDLMALVTSFGYGAYYVPKNVQVPFMPVPEVCKEKVGTVRTFESDIKRVKEYQEKYGFENQQEVVRKALDLLYRAMENPKMMIQSEPEIEKQEATEKPKEKDFSNIPSEDLKGKKTPGTATEKLDRAVGAIMHHNEFVATSNEDRWQINLSALRQLSGVRFDAVDKYLKEKRVMIDDHNTKYGLSDYHNQQHGRKKGIKIEDVIKW